MAEIIAAVRPSYRVNPFAQIFLFVIITSGIDGLGDKRLSSLCAIKRSKGKISMTAFTFHTDAGHGWLEVTAFDLADVGISPVDLSRYSYAVRNTYYLEEDCDAAKFIAAFVEKHGALPTFNDKYQHNSFVRALPRIK